MKHLVTRIYARQREHGWRKLTSMADWLEPGILLLLAYLLIGIGGCCNVGAY